MPDYEVPPEINSGRMYTGLGSASLMASAAAWQALSAQLGSAGAASARSSRHWRHRVVAGPVLDVDGPVSGPVRGVDDRHRRAMPGRGGSSGRGRAAFEAARAGVVPPPVIAKQPQHADCADRHQLHGLQHPGDHGQRGPYGQMWAQDTATMYGFAGQASGITGTLIPFTPPLRTPTQSGWPPRRPRWVNPAAPRPGSNR